METQGNRAPLKSFVLCSFQVAGHIFVVSVQVCQFALAYHPPGYQENVPAEKHQSMFMVVRFVSWAWISSSKWHSWGRNRPWSQRSMQGAPTAWVAWHPLLTTSQTGVGDPGVEAPHSHRSAFSWLLCQILTELMYESLYLKEKEIKAQKGEKLIYSDLLWTFYIIWYLTAIIVVWLICAMHDKCTRHAKLL